MKRASSLLITALMVARAFAPAVSALKPCIAASNVDTAGYLSPDGRASAADMCRAVSGTVGAEADLLFFSGDSRAEPVSWVQAPPGVGNDGFGIRLMNAVPGLDTFTEVVEITAHRTVTLDGSEDTLAEWTLQSGNLQGDVVRTEWYVREERLHSVESSVVGFRDVALEDAIAMGIIPEGTAPEDVAPEDVAPEDVAPGRSAPGTVTVRVPCIASKRTVEQSRPEWVPLTSSGKTLNAGETRQFKIVYTRPAGVGRAGTGAAPGVPGARHLIPAWWSTAWSYRVPVIIARPPPADGYPHREVVTFRTGMRSDFSDIRFVTGDGTVLDCWREAYTVSDSAVIRVNLPAGTALIWMYYGDAFARRSRMAGQHLQSQGC